jgi:ATP-binding cassette, subfamily B (MDR/TAP), member 1
VRLADKMAAAVDKQEATSKVGVTSPPKSTRKVGFLELFRFADPTDKGLYLLGGLFSVFTGITFPLFSLIFAGLLDAFFVEDPVTVISRYAGYLGLIGLANLIGGILGLGTILFVAERQGTKMRKAYLTALLRSEIGWHDVNHSLEAATRMSEDIGAVLKGLGEPLANTVSRKQMGITMLAESVRSLFNRCLPFVSCLLLSFCRSNSVLSSSLAS